MAFIRRLSALRFGVMMKIEKRIVAAICALGVIAGPAHGQSQLIESVTAEQLEAALDAAGLNPTMIVDANTGAPVGNGRAGEFNFFVRALSCSGSPTACSDLIFFANFDLGRTATAKDFRIVNKFNDSQVFGRAYVLEDQNQVGVDYVIELGGGVSEDHLAQNISRWADVINAFVAKFQEGSRTS